LGIENAMSSRGWRSAPRDLAVADSATQTAIASVPDENAILFAQA
jgi:hypothetical protein